MALGTAERMWTLQEYAEKYDVLLAENKRLKHEVDTTRGLWCIDRNPTEVDIDWVRTNGFQLKPLKGE